jgi:hypothetical protein
VGLPPGHVYIFKDEEKVPASVRTKAQLKYEMNRDLYDECGWLCRILTTPLVPSPRTPVPEEA